MFNKYSKVTKLKLTVESRNGQICLVPGAKTYYGLYNELELN